MCTSSTIFINCTSNKSPILEYNVGAWMPYQADNIKKIESFQATFTKLECKKLNNKFDSYHHRFRLFNLDTLEFQLIVYD